MAVLCTYCQATSIHCLQEDNWSYGQLSYTFHLREEKNSSIGFRKGEYSGRNCIISWGCAANHSFTGRKWWKAALSQMIAYTVMSDLNSPFLQVEPVFHWVHAEIWWGTLYCMDKEFFMWQRTPSLEMAAHVVISASHGLGLAFQINASLIRACE